MRIATWNVNSVRARLDRVRTYLTSHDIDVLALQETKVRDQDFPVAAFTELGYTVAHWGLGGFNGVAIISRLGLQDVERGFVGQPPWPVDAGKVKPTTAPGEPVEARAIGAQCGPLRLWSLYVPHGRSLDHPHFAYKLDFLAALRRAAQTWIGPVSSRTPAANERTVDDDGGGLVALVGDWNVAPRQADIWDSTDPVAAPAINGAVRAAFSALADDGWREISREHIDAPGTYTYWDYRQLRFPRNEGMRIDFAYASPALADAVQAVRIVRGERRGQGASDHVPLEFDLT